MGFGTLFIGYFLLLNVTFYSLYTDLLAALIMALGLYKLSGINRPFRWACYSSYVFAAVGAYELAVQFASFFTGKSYTDLTAYAAIPRAAIIATLTVFMLLGIREVSEEVGLDALQKRAHITVFFVPVIYLIFGALELPMLQEVLPLKAIAVLSLISLLSTFTLVAVNLVTIYSAYMRICMPEDKDYDAPEKPSRFEFINRHREHTKEKQREYAEYKLNKMIESNKKKSKKKKKK
ncbi:MAG: hypothetical protein J6V09_07665 [Clostridia bacterium]|nr:hypothetical protein [Clostridia bacterium]